MEVFRIAQTLYVNDLSGFGAYQFGGRWNSKGTYLLYTSQSPSLAMLEVLAHLSSWNLFVPYSILTLEIPEEPGLELDCPPTNWQQYPAPSHLQEIGNQFVKNGKHLWLKVPSVVLPMEKNILINPQHPDFRKIKIKAIQEITFDKRLFTAGTGV